MLGLTQVPRILNPDYDENDLNKLKMLLRFGLIADQHIPVLEREMI